MSINDPPSIIVIPIQGTFDIAQGRNAIRTRIALQHWPLPFNGRAATAMTALGELILLSNRSKAVPVRITFLNNQPRCGIELDCTLPKPDGEIVRWNSKTDNLARAADTLDMQEHGNQIEIRVCVWL
ncbi:MAG: hypothetical protein K8J31_26505 [Anaerolineae bacterium]|nr:hypothetical protein [Anaerolineae bacterium]